MNRRNFLKTFSKTIAGSTIFSLGFSKCTGRKKLPNIIIILSDDTGWNDVGYHGSEIKTPNIDKLARDGVELDNFYVYPTCSPTRASLLTGRPPSRFGILGPIAGKSTLALSQTTVTLAEFLKRRGYHTAITGKWHLGLRPEVGPQKYGFDYSYGYLHGQIDPYTHRYKFGDKTWHRNDELIEEEGHATDLITKEAIQFIQNLRDKSKPFFLYVPYSVPHFPLKEEQKWVDMYSNIQNESRRLFAASMTHMDESIGTIMETLRSEKLEENTFVIYMSDNGGQEKWGAPKNQYNGEYTPNDRLGNNEPLRGWKGDLYEGGIRVPGIFYWKGNLNPLKISEPFSVQDIFPTMANLIGERIEDEKNIEGINMWNILKGDSLTTDRILYWRTGNQIAVRKDNYKLIFSGKVPAQGKYELFNLKIDPFEKKNIIHDSPEKFNELKVALFNQLKADKNI